MPDLSQLFESINTFIELANKWFGPWLNETLRLSHVNVLFKFPIEVSTFNVNLLKFKIIVTHKNDIARAKFRSKLDMTEAYEQMHIRPEDVGKMTFSTIFSTFQSQVMQMGDCNAPSTFQWLMTAIFWDFLGRFVHVYLDDIFIYSQSIREHIEHTMKVLQRLRESQFYLSRSKLDLFSDKTDCLGHVIDNNGIHAKLDKMWWIREWRIPQNYNKVQKFLGLVQYLALYMPDIMVYTTLLSGSAQNNQTFQWTPLLDKCFQSIKAIAMWSPGHFLCNFICFGSLAESQHPLFESSGGTNEIIRSKSLFMHVPYDEHQPHTIGEMTEAVRQIIAWVCAKEKALPVS